MTVVAVHWREIQANMNMAYREGGFDGDNILQ